MKRFKSDLNRITDYFNESDFFMEMGIVGNDLKDLAELMTYTFFHKGELIIDTNTPQDAMYFILDGMVSFSVDYKQAGFKGEFLKDVG